MPGAQNRVDCALLGPIDSNIFENSIYSYLNNQILFDFENNKRILSNKSVNFYGAVTSGRGDIYATHTDLYTQSMNYKYYSPHSRVKIQNNFYYFQDVILISYQSQPGDSGALVSVNLNDGESALGMHIAYSAEDQLAVVQPLSNIFHREYLNLSI